MNIGIVVNHVDGGWTPEDFDNALGGGEEAVCHLALELGRLGHEIIVYQNGFEGEWRQGVTFKSQAALDLRAHDQVILRKCPEVAYGYADPWRFGLWTDQVRPIDPGFVDRFRAVVVTSNYLLHLLEIADLKLNQRSLIRIIPDGYDGELMNAGRDVPRDPLECLYASSWDRGLEPLLADVWPKIKKQVPKARLQVTYGCDFTRYPGGKEFQDRMMKLGRAQGVEFLGKVSRATMYQLYRASTLLLYPCIGGEYFCNSVVRAQVAGCIPVVMPWGGLRDTCRYGVKVSSTRDLAQAAVTLLLDPDRQWAIRMAMMRQATEAFPTWAESALEWHDLLSIGKDLTHG